MVLRIDRLGIDKFDRTDQGFLRIPANLSKTGIFQYRRADGSTVREFRPAEQVFDSVSVQTSELLPVTIGHPPAMVNPSNVGTYKVGQVVGQAKQDGKYLAATLQVETDSAIKQIESGQLKELSCGYSVDILDQPGEWEGQHYDCIQTNIRLNHVSLLEAGKGRQGSDVGLRMDSGDAYLIEEDPMSKKQDSKAPEADKLPEVTQEAKADEAPAAPMAAPGGMMVKISVDGEDFEVPGKVADAFVKMNDAIAKMAPAADPMAEEKSETPAEAAAEPAGEATNPDPNEELKKKADSKDEVEAQPEEDKARKDAQEQQLRFDAALDSRIELVEQAKKALPKLDWKGKSARQIQEQVLTARKVKHDGKSDDWVAGAFELALSQSAPSQAPKGLADVLIPSDSREDSKEPTADEQLKAARAKHAASYANGNTLGGNN